MSSRSSGSVIRVVITAAASAAVVAASILQPLAASAQTAPVPHRSAPVNSSPPPSRPHQWSAADALKSLRRPPAINAAAVRQEAIAHAAVTEKTASYRVSPATVAFLSNGLGLRLGSSTLLTGVRSGADLKISLPAPAGLRLGMPAGTSQPPFGRSTLVVNRATGAATLTASSPDGGLRITIPDAAAANVSISGDLSLRVPVLGEMASLAGQVSYTGGHAAAVSLSGRLRAGATLQRGVASLGADAEVTLSTADGLRVSGTALLGSPGRQLGVPVTGATDGTGDWTFTVRPGAVSAAPLPGLTLSPDATGTVISKRGVVSFDVSLPTARPWSPLQGVTASGTATFSNKIPNDELIPAPGIAARTPWIDVSGTVAVASAQAGPVTTHGSVVINLASGKGLVTSSGTTPVNLATGPHRLVLDQAGFRGQLALGKGGVTGSIRGTGRVTLTGTGRSVTTETALSVTPSGTLAASIPSAASVLAHASPAGRAAVPTSGTPAARTAGTAATSADSTSYTLSTPVFDFITQTLNIPLGSATLTGTLAGSTLTMTAAAPTALPSSLPSWLPNPSYVSTQISVDESTGTLTLSAATGTSGGQTATLTVTIASASTSDLSSGTDVTGSLVLGNVPFAGGSAASLDFTLGYSSGALSASLSGTTTDTASFANGLVTIPPGATLTLATGSGLALSGTADINSGSNSAQVTVNGTLTSLTDWSLTVSDAGAPEWQPATGLSVTPDFRGSITDTAGAIGFDLTTAGSGPAATWISPDASTTVSVGSLEVSNQAPSSTANCSTDEVKAGDLWIGLSGGFSYAPDNVDLQATGCFDLTGKTASISTTATGDLTSEFGSSLPFTVTDAGLTAQVSGDGTYSLTGSASVTITQGVTGDPSFNVGLSLSNTGIIAGIQIGDLSTLDSQFSGSGALYVSTSAADAFNPGATFGFTDQPSSIDLKAGLDVSLDFALPQTVIDDFQQIIPGFPDQASVQSMATLSSSGFTVDVGVVLGTGTGTGGVPVASDSNTGTAFYLDHLDVGLALGDQNQVTLSGTGYLVLPKLASGEDSSSLSVTVGGYFNITSLTLGLTFNVGNWTNDALGISGMSVQDFGGSFGLTLESGVPTPSLGIYADNLVLPGTWSQAIGVVPGTEISFNGNFSLSQPVLSISFTGQNGQPALTPLSIDPHASATEINSFTVNTAALAFAPFGGTAGTGDSLTPGVSVIFDANIAGVAKPVHVEANIDLAAPSIYANVYVGDFSTGPVQVTGTTFYLAITPTYYSLYFSGGISDGGYSFSAGISLYLGNTTAGGGVTLVVTGGLPSYLEGYAYLSGSVNSDGSISASGTGSFDAGGSLAGTVSFSLELPGTLTWSDFSDSIAQIVQFLQDAQTAASTIVSVLEQFGYNAYDIINTLGSIGDYSSGWLDDLASAFGFSTTYFDIVADDGQVLDVSGGSQSPSTQVITYPVNGGYNQDWEFVQSPYPGWYNVVSRGSGQCLTVQYNTATPGNPLIQYPCNNGLNQLWYMGGSISTAYTYVMWDPFYSNGTEEVADIQNASVWPGAIMDQWPYNGGWNQEFTLANSTN